MIHPVREWLFAKLSRGPADSQEVTDVATGLGVTREELRAACAANRVVEEERGAPGEQYRVWSLPPGYTLPIGAPLVKPPMKPPEPVRADLIPSKKSCPKARVEHAKNRLRLRAPRYVQYLDDLARKASDDATPCPTCGRGTPRSEEVRLRAVVAALDRSGVVPPRGEGDDSVPSGPVIVFPPGTTIGVIVQTPGAIAESRALRVTRGDELGA